MIRDFRWQLFKALSWAVKAPYVFTVNVGEPVFDEESGHSLLEDPLVSGTEIKFQACKAAVPFEGCEHYRVELPGHLIEIGVRDDHVQSVFYDCDIYRESGLRRMSKLRYLLKDHSEDDPLTELTDNGSAILYVSNGKTQFAAYAYLADTFLIYSTKAKPDRGEKNRGPKAARERERKPEIAESWKRIEQWLEENYQGGPSFMADGASDDALAAAEEEMGLTFPEGFKQWLRLHDGQQKSVGVIGGWRFLSLSEVVSCWRFLTEHLDAGEYEDFEAEGDGKVRADGWNRAWIPFLAGPAGDHYCVDLQPDARGREGQVLIWWHDWEDRSVQAASFEDWLAAQAEKFASGGFRVRGGYIEEVS